MTRLVSSIVFAFAACIVASATASAQDDKKKVEAPATDASAEIKAGTGVDKHEIVGEATSFPAGTMVWVWTRVSNANNTDVKHVWKRDGKEVWTATLPIKSSRWSTQSRRAIKDGSWEVEVIADGGKSLGSVKFTVQ